MTKTIGKITVDLGPSVTLLRDAMNAELPRFKKRLRKAIRKAIKEAAKR